jgi:hypothetical protein
MKSSIFWDITLCSPVKVNRSLEGTRHFHLQGRRISQARNQRESRWQAEPAVGILNRREVMTNGFSSLLSIRDAKGNNTLLSREKYLTFIAEVKRAKTAAKKVPRGYWLLQRHDVLVV